MHERKKEIRINLLHERREALQDQKKRLVKMAVYILLTLQLVTGLTFFHLSLQQDIGGAAGALQDMQKELEARAGLHSLIQDCLLQEKALEEKEKQVSSARQEKSQYFAILADLESAVPPGIWLKRVEIEAGDLYLQGEAQDPGQLARLIRGLSITGLSWSVEHMETAWNRDGIQFTVSCSGKAGVHAYRK